MATGGKRGIFCGARCKANRQNDFDPEKGIPQILEQIKTALYFEELEAKKELDGFGDKVGFTTLLHLGIAKFCKALAFGTAF